MTDKQLAEAVLKGANAIYQNNPKAKRANMIFVSPQSKLLIDTFLLKENVEKCLKSRKKK